jgi:hypothetical protein
MANPFETSTTYVTNTNSTSTVKFTSSPGTVLTLKPGELGFSYATGNFMIGPLNPSDPNTILISANNSFFENVTSDINYNITTKVPTSRSVAIALDKKADLTHSNQFTGMNEFPYLRIIDSAPAQENIAVTIKMIRDYLEGTSDRMGVIDQILADKLPKISTPSIIKRFKFNIPLLHWEINHDMKTTDFTFIVLDQDEIQNEAPFTIVDENTFIINFTAPMVGEASVTFHV